jgi:hypothetical protein
MVACAHGNTRDGTKILFDCNTPDKQAGIFDETAGRGCGAWWVRERMMERGIYIRS